ncbi:MAG: DHA2 family efflux MFS transporter permease subunit [Nocardioides sp.]|uniref:DHA2 family efflux MFS transporter permease subunit n=1 Tax=Nocardioides sp. TaxID=35761 RepID=UPI003EFD538C
MSETATTAGSAPESPDQGHNDKLDARVLVVAGVVVLGAIMSILDVTVVSVALKTWESDFGATTAEVAWTMTAYVLALATVIPLTGWAADRFGPKRLYLAAVTLFTLGSVLCALADTLPQLIAFRVVQGLGGGMLMPLGMTILTKAAGPERVGRVMAVMGIPMLLGPIFGPILGGWMIDNVSWHWIFLINLPIGIVALVYAWFALPKDHVEPSETFDFLGMVLLSPGLALFLYGISSIPGAKEEHGTPWTAEVVWTMVVGILLLVAFVPWALNRRNKHPLIDLRLFKNRNLTAAVVSMLFFGVSFAGASLLFPLFLQTVQGYTAMGSGAMLAPQGIGAMITMPIAGFLVDRIGPGKIVMAGITGVTVGLAMFTQVSSTTDKPYIWASLFVMGLGMGATMMPIMTAALATLVEHTIARGSTLMNIVSQVANAIGAAVFSVVLTDRLRNDDLVAASGAIAEAGGDKADPTVVAQILAKFGVDPTQLVPAKIFEAMAEAFQGTFVLAAVLVAFVLLPAFFLPRKKLEQAPDPTLMTGH